MKKTLSLLLSLILCLSFAISVYASEITTADHTNPFTGTKYTESDFYDNGMILVVLHHDYSIKWKEYTPEDFPEIQVESVKTHPEMSDTENPEYRGMVYITLRDKSTESVIEAIDALYERSDEDIYYTCPVSDTFYTGDEWNSEDEPIPGPAPVYTISETGATVGFYRNSDFTDLYYFVDDIPSGSTVYYKIICESGYFCESIVTNADTIDDSSFVMPESGLDFDPQVSHYGDTDKNNIVSLSDVSFMLKYLAGYAEVCYKVRGMGEAFLDFNTDGKINLSDCSETLKWIAGYDNAGPHTPDFEENFSIEHIDNNVSVASYFVSDAPLTVDSDGRKSISKYNNTVLTNTYDFATFVGDTMGVNDVFFEIVEAGDFMPSLMNTCRLKEVYNEDFFKDHDLVPLIIHTENTVYIENVRRSGSEIYSNIVIAGKANSDGIHNECCFFFIAVPKNSTESHSIRIMETDTFPDRFVTGFEY